MLRRETVLVLLGTMSTSAVSCFESSLPVPRASTGDTAQPVHLATPDVVLEAWLPTAGAPRENQDGSVGARDSGVATGDTTGSIEPVGSTKSTGLTVLPGATGTTGMAGPAGAREPAVGGAPAGRSGAATAPVGVVMSWKPVCVSPCLRLLDTSIQYRIVGRGIVTSAPFRIETTSTRIDAHVGTLAWKHAGIVTTLAGTMMLLGTMAYAASDFSTSWNESWDDDRATRTKRESEQVVTAVVSLTGLVTLLAGIAMLASNNSTAVSVESSRKAYDEPAPPPWGPGKFEMPF